MCMMNNMQGLCVKEAKSTLACKRRNLLFEYQMEHIGMMSGLLPKMLDSD